MPSPSPPARVRFVAATTLALALAVGATAARADTLEGLDPEARVAVVSGCLPERYREGPEAYRVCVEEKAAAVTDRQPGALELLDLDERYAVERRCAEARAVSRVQGLDCIDAEIASLVDAPVPNLDGLREDERHALLRGCFEIQNGAGVAAWRDCMADAADALRGVPAIDVSPLDIVERNALQAGCAAEHDGVDYRRCLLERGTAMGAPRASDTTAPGPSPAPSALALGRPAPAATEPDLGTALADERPTSPRERISAPAVEEPAAPDSAEPAAPVEELADEREVRLERAPATEPALGESSQDDADDAGIVRRLGEAYAGLDRTGRLLLWGALALPLLLLGTGAAMRRARGDATPRAGGNRPNGRNRTATGPSGPAHRTRRRAHRDVAMAPPDFPAPDPNRGTDGVHERLSTEADDLFDALDRDLDGDHDASFEDDPRAFALAPSATRPDQDPDPDPDRDAPTVLLGAPARARDTDDAMPDVQVAVGRGRASTRDRGDAVAADPEPHVPEPAAPTGEARREARDDFRGDFGAWLASRPEGSRRGLAIEFLVYWIAWSDERYDPAARKSLFAAAHPDDGTLVKRAVLDEDVEAFASTLRWLVLNTSREARAQILELLLALLVADASPTPVQNTLLRFLADVFGVGGEALEASFEAGFDAPMPPLPRVDRPDWWAVQDEAGLVRREARTLARAPSSERYRARLGLPLDGELSEADVLAAFELAARRCDPDRFDALGERERTLAARQLERFVDARTALLGEML